MNGTSWKTTLAGVATLLGAISAIITAVLGGDLHTVLTILSGTLIPAAIGLFHAKDNNVTGAGTTSTTAKS